MLATLMVSLLCYLLLHVASKGIKEKLENKNAINIKDNFSIIINNHVLCPTYIIKEIKRKRNTGKPTYN